MPPTGISYGDAKSVLKGEDNHVVLSAGASCFAVFDGHGGTKACKHGVDALAPAILALGVNASAFEYVDFSAMPSDAEEAEIGPVFDQPALSLVGDAAVVLGDCYRLDVVTSEQYDGELQACLVPPLPERMFPEDPRLPVNLSVCPTKVAPYHADEPIAIAAMLCFDECSAVNQSRAPTPEPRAGKAPQRAHAGPEIESEAP